MSPDKNRLLELAHQIHGEVCNCDDKYCTIEGEIFDWLYLGEVTDDETIESLVSEWKEYNEA